MSDEEEDHVWIRGNQEVTHRRRIAYGGHGEVHEVTEIHLPF